MRHTTLLFISILFSTASIFGQIRTNCFEVKYLDFFGIDNLDTIKWQDSEINQLLATDYLKDAKGRKTNYLIPLIVVQLKDYYPSCSQNVDTADFRKLKELYYKIRQQDITKINSETISKQLEVIREDFYSQVLNDSLLPYMNYTLDEGPFYGKHAKYIPDYKKSKAHKTEFGMLYITKYSSKVFLTAVDNQGKHLWTRIMTGNSNRYLTDISFSEDSVFKSTLGYQLRMISDGEALNLFLKSSGEFRFYFHSW